MSRFMSPSPSLLLRIRLPMTRRIDHFLFQSVLRAFPRVCFEALLLLSVASLVPLVRPLTLLLRIRLPMKMRMIRTHYNIPLIGPFSSSRRVPLAYMLLVPGYLGTPQVRHLTLRPRIHLLMTS